MGQEIELKLLIEPADTDRLIHHPLLSACLSGEILNKKLVNAYYDTPNLDLRKNGVALRVREDGGRFIQTLKQKGESRNGLSKRGEWEWSLENGELDLSLIPSELWPRVLTSSVSELIPLFRTIFFRTLWPISIPAGYFPEKQTSSQIEVSLDRGAIIVPKGHGMSSLPISEVELELREGEEGILVLVFRKLNEQVLLSPSDISKAERGYRLYSAEC